ncbi:hypothetical protein KIL84_005813 [Mauremys mutica]|uniref:Uncharacterized protein n=1 Tax=Mauremys mutica TaxID=74926 RepID=A0A9D3XH16_9SAUR|nr:hypothetical protein KIL84_005813 [Mauremys mutica]
MALCSLGNEPASPGHCRFWVSFSKPPGFKTRASEIGQAQCCVTANQLLRSTPEGAARRWWGCVLQSTFGSFLDSNKESNKDHGIFLLSPACSPAPPLPSRLPTLAECFWGSLAYLGRKKTNRRHINPAQRHRVFPALPSSSEPSPARQLVCTRGGSVPVSPEDCAFRPLTQSSGTSVVYWGPGLQHLHLDCSFPPAGVKHSPAELRFTATLHGRERLCKVRGAMVNWALGARSLAGLAISASPEINHACVSFSSPKPQSGKPPCGAGGAATPLGSCCVTAAAAPHTDRGRSQAHPAQALATGATGLSGSVHSKAEAKTGSEIP